MTLPNPVPLYRQTAPFSCGGASLAMALHALRGAPADRRHEFEYWREATMIGVPGICQWGLTVPALRRGIEATVISRTETTFTLATPVVKERFSEEQIEIAHFAQAENRQRAQEAGARWERRDPVPEDLPKAFAEGKVPILLVDLYTLSGEYMAPHWVVGSHMDGDAVVVHDPDQDGPGVHRMPLADFWRSMDVARYGATPTLVLLGP